VEVQFENHVVDRLDINCGFIDTWFRIYPSF